MKPFLNFSMFSLFFQLFIFSSVLACPQHDINSFSEHSNGISKRAAPTQDWAYEASYNWGMINKNYTLCQTGTQQSPIQLLLTQGLSLNHIINFNYDARINGNLYNWGYGPAFTVNNTNSQNLTAHPSMTYDNQTVWLKGWHIHAPADHSVHGDRSKAELHLVHADAEGHEKAVVAMRIDPGNAKSAFFAQFPAMPGFDDSSARAMEMDGLLALREVNMFNEFWTYKGSLTSPPCTEGIRWFVARNVLFVSVEQMQAILVVSTYSARVEQEVWQHQINV